MNLAEIVIYMADDDADDRYFMRKAFQDVNPAISVVEAEDGSELMELLATERRETAPRPVHLILLDINMPRMNGLETLTAIKTNPLLQHIPVVMISTAAEPAQMDTAYRNGASGFIKKPVSYLHIDQIAHAVSVCYLNVAAS